MEKARVDLLVMAAKLGDSNAFDQLCRHFQPGLLRFAYKLLNSESLAMDACQNTWLKMTKSIRRLDDPRAFKSWLYRSLRWQATDMQRKRINEEPLTEQQELEQCHQAQQHHDSLAINDDLLLQINHLSEIDKQAIYLFYLEEMTLQEISTVLGVPIGTVKSRLNRARNQLRKTLTNSCH
ncbi:sigma-70 family RNA polymerase sigma factor [Endozoicomonas sp. G2_1]|uniref:RNA polymerase sigma factor n=1 Tax=Endozoicomonas sp. G2_1 TaxID=2821091 RepID=UPI001AD997EF|nr:sigma-70 family RNA polymerase sigma factor [Endozoicomonas sp. G2_1]